MSTDSYRYRIQRNGWVFRWYVTVSKGIIRIASSPYGGGWFALTEKGAHRKAKRIIERDRRHAQRKRVWGRDE